MFDLAWCLLSLFSNLSLDHPQMAIHHSQQQTTIDKGFLLVLDDQRLAGAKSLTFRTSLGKS